MTLPFKVQLIKKCPGETYVNCSPSMNRLTDALIHFLWCRKISLVISYKTINIPDGLFNLSLF